MVYETKVSSLQTDPVLLSVPGLRDRATVFVDSKPAGVLSRFLFKLDSICYRIYLRSEEIYSLPLQISPGQALTIVVENQGRICYGPEIADRFGFSL